MRLVKCMLLLCLLFSYACSSKNKELVSEPDVVYPQPKVAVEQNIVEVVPEAPKENISFAENSIIYFDFDVVTPRQEEYAKIANQAKWLNSNPFKSILIEGHTDVIGSREYNLALGERRANTIKSLLIKYNVDPKKIKVVSYGKERLADKNINAKNRRTVTRVVN